MQIKKKHATHYDNVMYLETVCCTFNLVDIMASDRIFEKFYEFAREGCALDARNVTPSFVVSMLKAEAVFDEPDQAQDFYEMLIEKMSSHKEAIASIDVELKSTQKVQITFE